jgi:tRNA A-37 threonylcarbamoyl transferase component Bud32
MGKFLKKTLDHGPPAEATTKPEASSQPPKEAVEEAAAELEAELAVESADADDRLFNSFGELLPEDEPERNETDEKIRRALERGGRPEEAPSADPLEEAIRRARERLTLDDAGRRYAESHEFLAEIQGLDAGGRRRAADALLTDALLINSSPGLRRRLAERLIRRGDRDQARSLLEQLTEVEEHAGFALLSLGEICEATGDNEAALSAYERVLARDITEAQAKARARRLRAGRDEWRQRGQKDRAALTRFLGARAAGSRYAVLEEIGRGGAATVFRANDRVVGREVALKIYHPRGRAQDRRARILQEARIAGGFDHPHIVPILDIDEARDLLVMELCEGGSLRQRLAKGKLRVLDAAEIGAVLLRTVADIHAAGKLHLDIKPSNLLFHEGRPMLCDFGTAGMKEIGAAAGTRAYMAPEQRARGEATAKSDLYACGLVLFECIEGHLPAPDQGVALSTLPPGPRRRALEAFITRLLAADPDERPPAAALAEQLLVAASLPTEDGDGVRLLEHLEAVAETRGPEASARVQRHELATLLRPENPGPAV